VAGARGSKRSDKRAARPGCARMSAITASLASAPARACASAASGTPWAFARFCSCDRRLRSNSCCALRGYCLRTLLGFSIASAGGGVNLLCSESDSSRPTQEVELGLASHELDMVWNQLKGALFAPKALTTTGMGSLRVGSPSSARKILCDVLRNTFEPSSDRRRPRNYIVLSSTKI
jgi:hypothetical protein